MRFFDLDMPISIVEVEPLSWDPIELNNPVMFPLSSAFFISAASSSDGRKFAERVPPYGLIIWVG